MPYQMVGDGRIPDVRANGLDSQHINASLSILIATKYEVQNVPPLSKRLKKAFVSRESATTVADALSTIHRAWKRFFVSTVTTVHRLPERNSVSVVNSLPGNLGHPPLLFRRAQLKRKVVSVRAYPSVNPSGGVQQGPGACGQSVELTSAERLLAQHNYPSS